MLIKFKFNLLNFLKQKSSLVESILNTIAMLRPYWCCLQLLNDHDSTNLSDFVQSYLEKIKKYLFFEIL
jgi:hypothetical protein